VTDASGAPLHRAMAIAEDYEAWYHTPRGRWIGDTEFRLLRSVLNAAPGATLLDVGCGTGYFTRRFAGECGLAVLGLDPDADWLAYASTHGVGTERYCRGEAQHLPFADRCFDYAVSVTALCFVDAAREAIREVVRVTRRRFAIGLLNRRSLLYARKGRGGGTGAYRGARWHTDAEVRALLAGLPIAAPTVQTAVFLPSGNAISRAAERVLSNDLGFGAFVVAAASCL
jgi:SAM-dependent methyltransferase